MTSLLLLIIIIIPGRLGWWQYAEDLVAN